jgi:dTDP-4-amino-4,6-dideoxygalactose transaminase
MSDQPDRIHLSQAVATDVEVEYVTRALRSGWVAPLGPDVDAFEQEMADRLGVAGALALSSGTAALHLALLHLGARPGTCVVLSSMTFAATANAVAYTGARPVFVDARPEDANVDAGLMFETVRDLQERGDEVIAAIPVDLFGRPCDYGVLEPGLAELGVPLVEDAAEAIGGSFGGRAAGSFGRIAALSFNGNKILTTSGGGMLVGDDVDLLAHARFLSTQAREPVPWYEHQEIGYNYRLSNICAALGRAQLSRLDSMIERRRAIRHRYDDAFRDIAGIRLLAGDDGQYVTNNWLTSVVLDPDEGMPSAEAAVGDLNKLGIEARHLWKPMHLQPVFAGARTALTGVSDELFASGLTLPSGSALTDVQIDRVIAGLLRIVQR